MNQALESDFKLNYSDEVIIRKDDFDLLSPRTWLNDTLILFGLQYHCHRLFSEHDQQKILILPPTTLFLLRLSPIEFSKETAAQLELDKKEIILLPINDNDNPDIVGGSHWSLLVYIPGRPFIHLDSHGNNNAHWAKKAADLLTRILLPSADRKAKFDHAFDEQVPQQANGYDCGAYVIELGRCVLETIKSQGAQFRRIDFSSVRIDRAQLAQTIIDLAHEQKATPC